MTELLIFNKITPQMRARLEGDFAASDWADVDPDPWIDAHCESVRFILTDGPTGVPNEVLESLPNVEVISNLGVGYDGVDTHIALARGIPVSHTPGVLDQEVANTTVMLYLACWRNFEAEMALARTGRWGDHGNLPLPHSPDGRVIGILGLGRIGKAIAAKLTPWARKILYHGRSKQDVPYAYHPDLVEMAAACDALINISPGGTGTYRLINREVMDAIGPSGVLINVGRGSTVDESALIEALEAGTLGKAGLDVFENEPDIPERLRRLPNATLLPHVASASIETRAAMGDLAVDNLIAWKERRTLITPVPETASLLCGR
ncbi:MAG: 2-hydroxyacid dehydrogenase [Pseudomonadota bacterium]